MRLALLSLLMIATMPARSDGWLCIADAITGFTYDVNSRSWKPQQFRAEFKYVVRRATPEDPFATALGAKWTVQEFGAQVPTAVCQNNPVSSTLLTCGTLSGGEFLLNTIELRYLFTRQGGYFYPPDVLKNAIKEDGGPDDVAMEIGKCSPL